MVVVQGFLWFEHLEANGTFINKSSRKVDVFNMVEQVVLQSHILSTNRALKATCASLWSYYVCLQDVSVFQPWKCNSKLFTSFDFKVRLKKDQYWYASMYSADNSNVQMTIKELFFVTSSITIPPIWCWCWWTVVLGPSLWLWWIWLVVQSLLCCCRLCAKFLMFLYSPSVGLLPQYFLQVLHLNWFPLFTSLKCISVGFSLFPCNDQKNMDGPKQLKQR